MSRRLKKWFAIYDDELAVFGWTVLVLFLISAATIILNNYAETAFLKRFGVKHLPVIYMLNSALTFIIMGLLAGVMARLPGIRLLAYILVFFSGSVAALRFCLPFDFKLLYPLLYILKAQYSILLGLLFWNLANDLFNTRQAKRLFPLITAGGVVGSILGSAGTPALANLISMDNLMIAYAALMVLSALTVHRMGVRFPTLLFADKKMQKKPGRPSITKQFEDVIPLMKESALVGVLILLTLLPNVIIPVLNYQFNFAIDNQFATESGMVSFFGYFRSFMSAVSLGLLFFISKAYSRWGLPVALMFHPLNYLLVFTAFLLRFDVFAAMYARLSTNVIRTTLNKPVTDILMGIFPVSYRAALRPFLRGTVVRVGLFTGSGIILVTGNLFHPQYLSLLMLPLVIGWIATTIYLKRNYAPILAGLLSKNMLDLKSMERGDVRHLFKETRARQELMETFLLSQGQDAVWYARLLKSLEAPELDTGILSVLPGQDDKIRVELVKLLSDHCGDEAIAALAEIAETDNRALAAAVVQAARRSRTDAGAALCRSLFETTPHPDLKARAAAGFMGPTTEAYLELVDTWLDSGDSSRRLAGVVGSGESGQPIYVDRLKALMRSGQDPDLRPHALQALKRLTDESLNEIALPHIADQDASVRLAALEALEITGDSVLKQAIALLADPAATVRHFAREKIAVAPYQNGRRLIEALNEPDKRIRDGIYSLLATLDIKDLDTFTYAKNQIETCYCYLSEADALRHTQSDVWANLLADHLDEQAQVRLETLLRVVAYQDRTGQRRVIFKSLFSPDSRQKANAREALEDIADPALLKIFTPLVDDSPIARRIAIGRRKFKLPDYRTHPARMYTNLLNRENWITVILAFQAALESRTGLPDRDTTEKLAASDNRHIRRMAGRKNENRKEPGMQAEISIPDTILRLKKIDIFRNMPVNELAAIASITQKVVYPAGEILFKEGDVAESMYMVISGKIAAYKNETDPPEMFKPGDSLGGIVLLTDDLRLFTARATQETRLLVIHKLDFIEIVREYPQIALDISKLLCEYVKKLWQKVTDRSNTDGNSIFDGPAGIDQPG